MSRIRITRKPPWNRMLPRPLLTTAHLHVSARPVHISANSNGRDPMTSAERTTDEDFDKRLIEGLRSNNRESMAVVYDTYSSMAYGLALRTMGNATEAED